MRLFSVMVWSSVMLTTSAVHNSRPFSPVMADTTPQGGDTVLSSSRLSVRPRTMATGKETQQAGLRELEGLAGYYVYVPPQCVGTQRSSLVVLLHGGGRNGLQEVTKFQSLADQYGMIVLAGNAVRPGRWDVIHGWVTKETQYTRQEGLMLVSAFPEQDVRHLDTAITRVLRTHAIDLDRIALLGFSDGGSYSLFLGLSNLDIFSRIAPLSAMIPFDGMGPVNANTQIFLSGGVGERGMTERTLRIAQLLRQRGHPVMTQIGLRGHVDQVEDENFVWAWLQTSWANPAVTTQGDTAAESDPILTTEMLSKMTTFWTNFQRLSTAIKTDLRRQHQIQVPMTLGTERTTVITMNLPAMAAAAPELAALLDSVGLTAQTAMAYRNALLRIGIAQRAGMRTGSPPKELGEVFEPITPTSVLGKNLDAWGTHEVFKRLEAYGLWRIQ